MELNFLYRTLRFINKLNMSKKKKTSRSSPNWHSHVIEEIAMPETEINVTCPKRFIFFRVGFLFTGRPSGTHLPQHNQNVLADLVKRLFFSVICGVEYTLQYQTHVSVGSSSSSSKKRHSTVANLCKSEEERGAGLVLTGFSWYTKTLYLFGSNNITTAKNSRVSRWMSANKVRMCLTLTRDVKQNKPCTPTYEN